MDDKPANASQYSHTPLVRYGEYVPRIPGDEYGKKLPHSGNISHAEDDRRAEEFPVFDDTEFCFENENRAEAIRRLLTTIRTSVTKGELSKHSDFTVLEDTQTQKTVEFSVDSLSVRVSQYKDVTYSNKDSYTNAQRAVRVEDQSTRKLDPEEAAISREVQSFLLAKALSSDDYAIGCRVTLPRPAEAQGRKKWYKDMRTNVTRSFWLDHDSEGRSRIRAEAKHPPGELLTYINEIAKEDHSFGFDHFSQHIKDWKAAADPAIYTPIDKDVFVLLDRNGDSILCSVSRLFQRLFGEATVRKVVDAVKKWSELPPLPEPNTTRHMVDELIRRHHPELDMEKATTAEELIQRPMCVVHYGTWAMKGHMNPKNVYLTAETRMMRGVGPGAEANYAAEAMPRFKRGVLGLSSEVVRLIFRSIAPKEYEDCMEVFKALPKEKRMSLSQPTFTTLCVLGINSFTERHRDRTDVRYGFAGLVPLGDYTGGDLCFPQLALKLAYRPGGCVVFRGAELEHFVEDWHGYRIFVACTNHQPVKNYAYRRLGRKPALPSDPWYNEARARRVSAQTAAKGEAEDEEEQYDPCVVEELDQEEPPEGGWTNEQIHGAGTWSPDRNAPGYPSDYTDSSGSGSGTAPKDDPTFSEGSSTKRLKLE
ncbi:hypothetical protein DL767_001009 [Monosporascus sp. MG133]|nr:hypothetical protein DL767_001009 [Monosporascus sp. MG133]